MHCFRYYRYCNAHMKECFGLTHSILFPIPPSLFCQVSLLRTLPSSSARSTRSTMVSSPNSHFCAVCPGLGFTGLRRCLSCCGVPFTWENPPLYNRNTLLTHYHNFLLRAFPQSSFMTSSITARASTISKTSRICPISSSSRATSRVPTSSTTSSPRRRSTP